MGSEKGLEGRGRGKKRRLEGLEVKMTSSFSPLFLFLQKAPPKVGKLPSFFLPKASICHLEEHSKSSWIVPLHITQALFLWLPSSVSKNQWSKDHSRLESTESLHI